MIKVLKAENLSPGLDRARCLVIRENNQESLHLFKSPRINLCKGVSQLIVCTSRTLDQTHRSLHGSVKGSFVIRW
ncbi:protein of unknown function (plasmid) [Cupriavidus taiwanensis]|uniref:Uncharacterized protein n=1 Tax=Cupriavidus taiwanensis TaxID=164546 RepID=A0A9Q7UZ75_9BURK|nr:protein of unknown function [Cupriavidus taiwanensis]